MRRALLVTMGTLVLAGSALAAVSLAQDYKDPEVTTPVEPPGVIGLLCRVSMADDYRELRVRPLNCNTMGYQDSFAEAVNLKNLVWSNWGEPEARARGIVRSWKNYGTLRYRTFVKAYRPRLYCDGPDSVYTRIRLSKNGKSFPYPPVVIPECDQ